MARAVDAEKLSHPTAMARKGRSRPSLEANSVVCRAIGERMLFPPRIIASIFPVTSGLVSRGGSINQACAAICPLPCPSAFAM